jgi:hypothetical protein
VYRFSRPFGSPRLRKRPTEPRRRQARSSASVISLKRRPFSHDMRRRQAAKAPHRPSFVAVWRPIAPTLRCARAPPALQPIAGLTNSNVETFRAGSGDVSSHLLSNVAKCSGTTRKATSSSGFGVFCADQAMVRAGTDEQANGCDMCRFCWRGLSPSVCGGLSPRDGGRR